jgi:hypothetical protein
MLKYEGAWKDGKFDGAGVLYDIDGSIIYSGKFR